MFLFTFSTFWRNHAHLFLKLINKGRQFSYAEPQCIRFQSLFDKRNGLLQEVDFKSYSSTAYVVPTSSFCKRPEVSESKNAVKC